MIWCELFVIALVLKTSLEANSLYNIGPKNITRYAGENNVFIPCPFNSFDLPFWEINGSYYDLFNLPQGLFAASKGIIIPTVAVDMNTTFRCYFTERNSYSVEGSSTGILTVLISASEGIGVPVQSELLMFENFFTNRSINLDHQNIYFNETYTEISWKPLYNCNSYVYSIHSNFCGEARVRKSNSWPTNYTKAVLANAESRDVFFDITCAGGDITLFETFTISSNVTTYPVPASFSRSNWITIIKSTALLSIVIPVKNSTMRDCVCPLYYPNESGNKCNNLIKCACVNDTVFVKSVANSIEICDLTELYQVQFINLTNEMDKSRFHIFTRKICGDQSYRTYLHSFEIVKVLPEPPNVGLNYLDERLNITFASPHKDKIYLDEYQLTIYDISGGQILAKTFSNYTTSYVSSNILSQLTQCKPYIVSVKAVNSFGFSDTNITLNGTTKGDTCSCIEENVHATLKYKTVVNDDSVIQVTIQCLQVHYNDVKVNVEINDANTTIIKSITFPQSDSWNSQSTILDGLKCNSLYNLSAYWIAPNGIATEDTCLLYRVENVKSLCSEIQIKIGTTVSLGAILIITMLVLNVIICFNIKKRRREQIVNITVYQAVN